MKNIYLAGPCGPEDRDMMMHIAELLRNGPEFKDKKFTIYCPFELKIPDAWNISQEEWARRVYEADVKAIDSCDTVVIVSLGRASTAGTNWEQGYAFAKRKPVYVFQITDRPTSLMTYWGCTAFRNTSIDAIDKDLLILLEKEPKAHIPCATTLT